MEKRKSYQCPLCEVYHSAPFGPSTKDGTYNDDCACGEWGSCVTHQFNPEDRPKRPSEEVIKERSQKAYEARVARYDEKRRKVELFNEMIDILHSLDCLGCIQPERCGEWGNCLSCKAHHLLIDLGVTND